MSVAVKLYDEKKHTVNQICDEKKHTVNQICDIMGISKPTLYKYIEAAKQSNA